MSETAVRPLMHFDNSYARELPGLAVPWQPTAVPGPSMLYFNRALAEELALDADALDGPRGVAVFSGNEVPEGAMPIAQAYAGHQFGGFSPSLGDGRALLLGEVIDRHGRRRDIAFKGSGATPFSRGGDGKAAVGPGLREAIFGAGMHAHGIPTTRALAAVATGEPVMREDTLPGAVLTHTVQSLTFDLFKVSFSAECTREPVGATRIRVIDTVQGTVVPLEPYDGGQVFCQAAPAATYSGSWLRRVGAGTHTLQVQIFSTAGLTLIDDWTFELVVYD